MTDQLPSKERDILAELRRYHAEIVACDGAECEAMRLTRWAIEEIERLSRKLDTCESALRNCLLLAMRHARRDSDWEHIIRFCAQGGVEPSPLRTEP